MIISRCVNCMKEIEGYPCTHCGFNANVYPQLDYALPLHTILSGKYLVGKVLGQGGFGITYVGWNLVLDQKIAVKEYYPAGQVSRNSNISSDLQWSNGQSESSRKTGIESFVKEARKMARVDQIPQIVRVRDVFFENNTAYIIMDFVDGETLKTRLAREGAMPFERAMDIFRPALAAMDDVHKAGLIHRDLSPDNIMLESDGSIRILDLGAAKDLSINNGASSILVAKGGFSPIEQYSQRGGSGAWTDVYAMAATIYYTLTGIVPPNAIDRLDNDELRWDLPELDAIGASAKQALKKALAVNASDRTQTMAELLEGLELSKQTAEQTSVEKEKKRTPSQKPVFKPKKLWIVIAAVIAVIVMAISRIPGISPGVLLEWKLSKTGELTIFGYGGMYDYASPWDKRSDEITSVVIKQGVTSIGDSAFSNCTNLTYITIPDSVTSIGDFVFSNCTNLTYITIPDSVTSIGDSAFDGCEKLASVSIPGSVTKIGSDAFKDCKNLKSITMPYSVTEISRGAFYYCTNLTNFRMPNSVTEIGSEAFEGCNNLSSITLSNKLTNIGVSAFKGCERLLDVYYNGTAEQWNNVEINADNDDLLNANIHFSQ